MRGMGLLASVVVLSLARSDKRLCERPGSGDPLSGRHQGRRPERRRQGNPRARPGARSPEVVPGWPEARPPARHLGEHWLLQEPRSIDRAPLEARRGVHERGRGRAPRRVGRRLRQARRSRGRDGHERHAERLRSVLGVRRLWLCQGVRCRRGGQRRRATSEVVGPAVSCRREAVTSAPRCDVLSGRTSS
jgi:hypothetical protein